MSEVEPNTGARAALDELAARASSASLPQGLHAALRARFDDGPLVRRRQRQAWAFAFAVASFAVIVGVGYRVFFMPKITAGFAIASASADLRAREQSDGSLVIEEGQATLELPREDSRLTIVQPTVLRRTNDGVRIVAGQVAFDVAPRPHDHPLHVHVGQGTIEVVGTRFVVNENDQGGNVEVTAGVIRFTNSGGVARLVRAGENAGWSSGAVTVPADTREDAKVDEPEPRAPSEARLRRPDVRKNRPADTEPSTSAATREILVKIDAMRIRRDYAHLQTYLTKLLRQSQPEPLRERLSFELCEALAIQAPEHDAACARVHEHMRRYPASSYAGQLQQIETRLACDAPKPR